MIMAPMSQPSTSLRGLRTFCVAAKHESFRKAGEILFVTSSAISHQIKSLEQELGVQLFERGSRDIKLTDVGKELYEEVSPLIDRLNTIATSYKQGGRRSSIRISVQPFFASEYFVPRLSEFTADNPDIDIQVGTSDETPEKHPSDADLSIRLFRTPPENLVSNRLFPLRLIPAGSPDFKTSVKVRKKAIISDFPLIVHDTQPKAWKDWAKSSGIELPKDSKVTRLDSMIAVVRAAEQGIGAALVPVPITDLWLKQGSIVRLFKEELVDGTSYYLVCNEDRAEEEPVRRLCEWILQNFADPS